MNEGYNYAGKRYIASVRASDDTDGNTSTKAQLAMLHQQSAALKMIRVDEILLDGVTGSMPGKRQDMTDLPPQAAGERLRRIGHPAAGSPYPQRLTTRILVRT